MSPKNKCCHFYVLTHGFIVKQIPQQSGKDNILVAYYIYYIYIQKCSSDSVGDGNLVARTSGNPIPVNPYSLPV